MLPLVSGGPSQDNDRPPLEQYINVALISLETHDGVGTEADGSHYRTKTLRSIRMGANALAWVVF